MKKILSKVKTICIFVKILMLSVKKRIINNTSIIYFISTPTHGNLGDQAIVFGQYELIKSIGKSDAIIEMTKDEYLRTKVWLNKLILPHDIIVIDGGGNIGTLWINEEEKMRDILQRFQNNKVIIFPQTAYFENSMYGRNELSKSIQIYQAHNDLTVFCRDIDTFQLFQNMFPKVSTYYTPDIVLYLKPDILMQSREGVLLCFRKDLEKSCSIEILKRLKKFLKSADIIYCDTSTLIDGDVYKRDRETELRRKWREFSAAQLVVTDRLHGMIFCAITGTPCVALDNVSHKVRNGYKWISYLPYIKFVEEESQLIDVVSKQLSDLKSYQYDAQPLEQYFSIIKNKLLNH